MNRFAFIVCKDGHIEFVIPEINLRGSEPTENVEDVVSLMVNRYNVTEYQGNFMHCTGHSSRLLWTRISPSYSQSSSHGVMD